MSRPLVSLYCVVLGDVYERYAARLAADAREWFLPGAAEFVVLEGEAGRWPHTSASRYKVALDRRERLRGEWVFQIDADMRILQPVGREILADGVTVTTHPGFDPVKTEAASWPYCRNPHSRAYVQVGAGRQYHPGCFVGGRAEAFFELAGWVVAAMADDAAREVPHPRWYDEAYLNRFLLDRPPALVLDRRYCWWQQWGDEDQQAIVMHLDKTEEEFAWRDAQ